MPKRQRTAALQNLTEFFRRTGHTRPPLFGSRSLVPCPNGLGRDGNALHVRTNALDQSTNAEAADQMFIYLKVKTVGVVIKTVGAHFGCVGAMIKTVGVHLKTEAADQMFIYLNVESVGVMVKTVGAMVESVGMGFGPVGQVVAGAARPTDCAASPLSPRVRPIWVSSVPIGG